MKKTIIFILLMFAGVFIFACPACEKQQPELLRGISHGTGPTGNSDYIIIIATAIIVLISFILFLKYTIFPKEKSEKHIKRKILNYGK